MDTDSLAAQQRLLLPPQGHPPPLPEASDYIFSELLGVGRSSHRREAQPELQPCTAPRAPELPAAEALLWEMASHIFTPTQHI